MNQPTSALSTPGRLATPGRAGAAGAVLQTPGPQGLHYGHAELPVAASGLQVAPHSAGPQAHSAGPQAHSAGQMMGTPLPVNNINNSFSNASAQWNHLQSPAPLPNPVRIDTPKYTAGGRQIGDMSGTGGAVSVALRAASATPSRGPIPSQAQATPSQQGGRTSRAVEEGKGYRVTALGATIPVALEELARAGGSAPDGSALDGRGRFFGAFGAVTTAQGAVVWRLRGTTGESWSPLAHARADRPGFVAVSPGPTGSAAPRALLCTEDGALAYTPDCASPDSRHELLLPLKDDEAVLACEPSEPVGFVAVTSAGRVFHIVNPLGSLFAAPVARLCAKSAGLISGLARLLGLGGGAASAAGSNPHARQRATRARVATRATSRGTCEVLVLTDLVLEKWDLSLTADKFEYEHPLRDSLVGPLTETAARGLMPEEEPPVLDVHLLDHQYLGVDGLTVVLVATVQTNLPDDRVPVVCYTLVEVDVRSSPPTFVEGKTIEYDVSYDLHGSEGDRERARRSLAATRLVVPPRTHSAFVLGIDGVVATRAPYDEQECAVMLAPRSRLGWAPYAAWGCVGTRLLLLTSEHGIVAVHHRDPLAGGGDNDAEDDLLLEVFYGSDDDDDEVDEGGDDEENKDNDGYETGDGSGSKRRRRRGRSSSVTGAGRSSRRSGSATPSRKRLATAREQKSRRLASEAVNTPARPAATFSSYSARDGAAPGATDDREQLLRRLETALELFQGGSAASTLMDAAAVNASGADPALLGEAVAQIGQHIVNSQPESTPFWAESAGAGGAATPSASVLLKVQLDEKKAKHFALVDFLRQARVWPLLPARAAEALAQQGEKLSAAIALRTYENMQQHGQQQHVLMRAMERIVRHRAGWSTHDLFYGNVESIDAIVPAVAEVVAQEFHASGPRNAVGSEETLRARLRAVLSAGEVLHVVLVAAFGHRATHAAMYEVPSSPSSPSQPPCPVPAWARQPQLVRALDEHIASTREVLADPLHKDEAELALLLDQLYVLSDVRLAADREELRQAGFADAALQQRHARLRGSLIEPFEQRGQTVYALSLAEKFEDFQALVRLAHLPSAPAGLPSQLLERYGARGYAEALFAFLFARGDKRGLLSQPEPFLPALERFLQPHPDLLWEHLLRVGNTAAAARVLSSLGPTKPTLGERRLLLSLAKLSLLAEGGPGEAVALVGDQLNVIHMQELLLRAESETVSDEEIAAARPMAPEEIIEAVMATEDPLRFNFALGVFDVSARSRPPAANDALYLRIWLAAVRANPWGALADQRLQSALSDTFLWEAIEDSAFYTTACAYADEAGRPRLTQATMAKITASIEDKNQKRAESIVRILETAFRMIQGER